VLFDACSLYSFGKLPRKIKLTSKSRFFLFFFNHPEFQTQIINGLFVLYIGYVWPV